MSGCIDCKWHDNCPVKDRYGSIPLPKDIVCPFYEEIDIEDNDK